MWLWFFLLLLFLISASKSEIQGCKHFITRQECSQLKYINIYDLFKYCENRDCNSVVTTLLRLLALSILIAAMKIDNLYTQHQQNHSISVLWPQFVAGYRSHCRSPVLWAPCVRIVWIFLGLILMWCHFRSPFPILIYRKLSHTQFLIATKERLDFWLKSGKRKKYLFLQNPS